MDLIGYGVCGAGEADKYMEKAMESFQICDEVVIVTNNATQAEKDMLDKYGYNHYEDNREWGTHQHLIKQKLLDDYIAELNPDWCLCMDMDEKIDPELSKDDMKELERWGEAMYVYIVDLWEDGWKPKRAFWNIRAYKWDDDHRQIKPSPLHCGLAPKWAYHHGVYTPFYLLHYGLKTKELREQKIERYSEYDPDADYIHQEYYDSLHEEDFEEFDLDDLKQELIHEWENDLKPTTKKEKRMQDQDQVFRMKRPSDGKELPIQEGNVQDRLDDGWEKLGTWHDSDDEQEETSDLQCPFCGKVCGNKAGLTNHKKACQ